MVPVASNRDLKVALCGRCRVVYHPACVGLTRAYDLSRHTHDQNARCQPQQPQHPFAPPIARRSTDDGFNLFLIRKDTLVHNLVHLVRTKLGSPFRRSGQYKVCWHGDIQKHRKAKPHP